MDYKLKWSVRLSYRKLLFVEISPCYTSLLTSQHATRKCSIGIVENAEGTYSVCIHVLLFTWALTLNSTPWPWWPFCGHIPLVGRTKHPKTVDRFCKNPTKQFKKVPLTTALSLMTYDCFTLLSLFTGRNKGRRGIHTQRSCWKLSGHQVSLMILTPHLPSAMNLVVVRCTCIAKLNDFNRLCRALINV